jgi:hypothetical protein
MSRYVVPIPAPLKNPALLLPFLLGASSIASLLLYFYGLMEMGRGARSLAIPAVLVLVLGTLWAKYTQRVVLYNRILAGLFAGACATLAYDLVRVPIAWSGIPVFKAISYFGTVIVGQPTPTVASDVYGWAYHLSNGVGFGLMYTALIAVPRWWSAVLWGLLLEGAMLITPYAEVFGYRVSPEFLAITIGGHIVYGATLWASLRYWCGGLAGDWSATRPLSRVLLTWWLVPLGIGVVAADFHLRHGRDLPPSPPGYLGAHLYTTWNVLEPDRLAALWVFRRFVEPQARFHFVPPFSRMAYGIPFDTPEAGLRRSATQSVTEILLAQNHLQANPQLALLARMTHLYEVTPWMRPADPAASQLGQELIMATGRCPLPEITPCVERAFHYLDAWYLQKK